MQLTSLFTLLPLLAAVSWQTSSSSLVAAEAPARAYHAAAPVDEPTYDREDDDGTYHDEEDAGYDSDEDDRAYDKKPEQRVASAKYEAVSHRTVVLVVAKRTPARVLRPNMKPGLSYVTPAGHPVSPAVSPYMLPINRIVALRNNEDENDDIKRNRVHPEDTKCLTVRRRGFRNRFKARMEKCSDEQRFWKHSPMSFRFEPAGEGTVLLTWMDPKGVKRCAKHDTFGTRFYPCNDPKKKPTRYVILPTAYTGKFKIKQADRNRCFDGEHSNLWMNRCRGFSDQGWDIVTIAYDDDHHY